jgi:5'-nucleotidase
MRILITNDDGIHGEGLRVLANVARKLGEVKIVAPDRERSACGHAMTLRDPLRVTPVEFGGLEAYTVNGVPVDCVNVGLNVAWPDGCDLVLSGINHGPNLGFDVTYSGTVAGAMEGAINGIRSISLSLATFVFEAPPHWETATQWLDENLADLCKLELKELTFLNINIPSIAYPEVRGMRWAEMGRRVYQERVEKRDDPWGRPYYWQGGAVIMAGNQPGTDVNAVSDGYVSATPISLNWTDSNALARLQK